jgi:hypothetical protein
VNHVPNIITIDKIDKLLEGEHPDKMGSIRNRFRLGLFLARKTEDPISQAFIEG